MPLEVTARPSEGDILGLLPVEFAKANVRILSSTENALFQHWILAAHALLDGLEGYVRRPILPCTVKDSFGRWPRYRERLSLSLPDVLDVETFEYLDAAGDPQEITTGYELVKTRGENPHVRFASSWIAPSIDPGSYPITVTYRAGFPAGHPGFVLLKQAMMLLVGHYSQNREESFNDPRQALTNKSIVYGIERLLGSMRLGLDLTGGRG